MNHYFGGQVPPAMDDDRQHQQQPGPATSSANNDASMTGFDPSSYSGIMFGQDSNQQLQAEASRRHSVPHLLHSYAEPQHLHQQHQQHQTRMSMSGLTEMQLLNFSPGVGGIGNLGDMRGDVEDAFKNFSFGTTDASGTFLMPTLPGQSMGLSSAAMTAGQQTSSDVGSGFPPTTGMLASAGPDSGPFSALSQDFVNNMMAYQHLDLSQIDSTQPGTLDAASLAYFTTAGPDPGSQATAMSGVGLDNHYSASPVDAVPTHSFVPPMDMEIENSTALLGGHPAGTLAMDMASNMQQQQAQRDIFATSQPSHSTQTSATSLARSRLAVLQQQQQQQQEKQRQAAQARARARVQAEAQLQGGFGKPFSSELPSPAPPHQSTSGTSQGPASTLPTGPSPASTVPASHTSPVKGSVASAPVEATLPYTNGSKGVVAGPQPPPPGPSTTPSINYSSSGFDMVRALYYVSSRPNPEIAIGPVDLSCAFVVCDATLDDYPIIYISDNFQHLTGYSNHEILGQNCRFLQAPDGRVEAGTRREFTDNKAVLNIKEKLQAGREVQQSLINYRKGGTPFLNLLTMIPIPWDGFEGQCKYVIGLQIDLVESPDAVSGQSADSMRIDYKHRSSIPQYIWDPPKASQWSTNHGRTLGLDDVSGLLQQYDSKRLTSSTGSGNDNVGSAASDMYRQSWDKMLLENSDDVIHVLSLKGVFLYLSPSCKDVLEYESADLLGTLLSSICHPSDIVPVTREMRDTQAGQPINFVYRVRRKRSGYTWFESHGSLLVDQGKGRKCIVLVGRKRPAYALRRCDVEINGGIGDSEIWTKLSTSGMILHVSSNLRSLLDTQPDSLVGTSMQDLMRKESRAGFNRSLDKVRRGIISSCRHEVQHRRGQVLQASTILYPGDAEKGAKPTFVLGQTRLLKSSSSRNSHGGGSSAASGTGPVGAGGGNASSGVTSVADADEMESNVGGAGAVGQLADPDTPTGGYLSSAGGGGVPLGSQDALLAADDNIFDELKTTRCTSWQYELRQMEKANRLLAEELGQLLANRKKRKRRKGVGNVPRDCANCHTRSTPEWRRGPSGQRDLCNSCGLRWAKQVGRVSPRNSSRASTTIAGGNGGGNNTTADAMSKKSMSPIHASPRQRDFQPDLMSGGNNGRGSDPSSSSGNGSNGNGGSTKAADQSSSNNKTGAFAVAEQGNTLLQQLQYPPSTGTEMTAIKEERESSP